MIRALTVAGLTLVLSTASLSLYLFRASPPSEVEISIPLQVSVVPGFENKTPVEPEDALQLLSRNLTKHGISLLDPKALESLPAELVESYVDKAVNHRAAFFSHEFSASSLRVVAAWLARQQGWFRFSGEAWEVCLNLRWSVANIAEIAASCRKIGAGLFRFEMVNHAMLKKHAGYRIADADRMLARKHQNYLRNPFDPERLEELALALARNGHTEVADKLVAEMLQLNVERASRLEHELSRRNGPAYPGFQFDFTHQLHKYPGARARKRGSTGQRSGLVPEIYATGGFSPLYSPPCLLRSRQAPRPGRFARSRILNGQASTLPVLSVAKRPGHRTCRPLATARW